MYPNLATELADSDSEQKITLKIAQQHLQLPNCKLV